MSYSRFGSSHWYTYWCSSASEVKEEQLFDVCPIKTFTFKELTEEREKCLDIMSYMDIKSTEEELKELNGYMDEFVKDVEEAYDGRPPKQISVCENCDKFRRYEDADGSPVVADELECAYENQRHSITYYEQLKIPHECDYFKILEQMEAVRKL